MALSTAWSGRILAANIATGGGVVIQGGSWATPYSYLTDIQLRGRPFRCTAVADLTASRVEIVLPGVTMMTDLLIYEHTLSTGALRKVTWSDDDAYTAPLVWDWDRVDPRVADSMDLPWSQPEWWLGTAPPTVRAAYGQSLRVAVPGAVPVKRILVELDDRHHPDGAFDLGYLYLANAIAPEWNYDFGRQITPITRSQTRQTVGGRKLARRRRVQRTMQLTWRDLSLTEARRLLDVVVSHDTVDPIVIVPDPTDDQAACEVFLATFAAPLPKPVQGNPDWTMDVTVEEVLG